MKVILIFLFTFLFIESFSKLNSKVSKIDSKSLGKAKSSNQPLVKAKGCACTSNDNISFYDQNYEPNYFLEENFGTPFWYYNSYASNSPFFYDYPFNWRYNYW